ncbi:hypothetical protein Q0Z83_049970 [Actinoplanes sichuanensis]|nr:hypothetical protein Q0Z83_049970 [Actinoplanes sichuanensis]
MLPRRTAPDHPPELSDDSTGCRMPNDPESVMPEDYEYDSSRTPGFNLGVDAVDPSPA